MIPIKTQHFQIAYKLGNNSCESLKSNDFNNFKLIPNTWRYWTADPFLYKFGEKIYLFCEMFDTLTWKGSIGYSEWKGNGFSKYRPIITEPFHMSYPHIFEHSGNIYMIPETEASGELRLYKAVNFPDKWCFEKTLKNNFSCVDTTIIKNDGKYFGNTLSLSDNKVWEFILDNNLDISDMKKCENQPHDIYRNGGNMFLLDESIIRITQDCRAEYGYAMFFRKLDKNSFGEKSSTYISPNECSAFSNNKPIKICGVHTYNFCDNLEVIDIKQDFKIHLPELVCRIYRIICHKIKKGLLKNEN